MKQKKNIYPDRIIRIPGLLGEKPVVKWTRIPVELILHYLAYDPHVHTLFEAFPSLTLEDVKAYLVSAEALVEKEQQRTPEKEDKQHNLHL
jgi:uncharacterized protein (DUF433 family)